MRETHRARLERYIAQLEEVAVHAEELMGRVTDAAYKSILQTEVSGYRDLIQAWRLRLHREFPKARN